MDKKNLTFLTLLYSVSLPWPISVIYYSALMLLGKMDSDLAGGHGIAVIGFAIFAGITFLCFAFLAFAGKCLVKAFSPTQRSKIFWIARVSYWIYLFSLVLGIIATCVKILPDAIPILLL